MWSVKTIKCILHFFAKCKQVVDMTYRDLITTAHEYLHLTIK